MSETTLKPSRMWGLFNRTGDLCYVFDRKRECIDQARAIFGCTWRRIRERGDMSIAIVYVVPEMTYVTMPLAAYELMRLSGGEPLDVH